MTRSSTGRSLYAAAAVLGLWVMLAPWPALATNDYYVSPSGSGSACTVGSPCALGQVTSVLTVGTSGSCLAASGWLTVPNAGACVHVLSGDYSGDFTFTKSGGTTTRIVYLAESRWGPKLTGAFTLNGSFSEIDGFDITNPSGSFAVLMQAGSHRSVQYNYIHDVQTSGCSPNGVIHETTAPSDHDIINANIIRHFGSTESSTCGQGFHGIYADGAALQITNNIISGGAGGWGIQKQYASITDCTPGIISNNTIFNNQGGIVLNDEGSSCGIDHWTVSNNIIVNNGVQGTCYGWNGSSCGGSSFGVDYWHMAHAPDALVTNNLVYGNLPADFARTGSACTPPVAGCPGVNTLSDTGVTATFASFQSDTNASPAAGYDPDNYRLKAGSSAVDNGTTTCAPSPGLSPCAPALDFDGAVRPRGAAYDIGAFELSSGLPSPPTNLGAVVH